jgi:serine/threonine protein kinase
VAPWASSIWARHTAFDRRVALKQVTVVDGEVDSRFPELLLREARTAGRLRHPNTIAVFGYFERGGTADIAMDYAERGSLRQFIGN